jgi:hypothetical protein
MADMVAAVRRMPEAKRAQYSRLVGVRALTGCTKSIVELVSADLFLQLNGMDYARTARIVAALTTINTVSDFVFNPIMGGLLDAYGRKVSLLAAQVLDGATALLVGVRPSVPNFVAWQLLREFSRRANKPARLAMMGDFVGRASADFVHLYNFAEVTLLRHLHIPYLRASCLKLLFCSTHSVVTFNPRHFVPRRVGPFLFPPTCMRACRWYQRPLVWSQCKSLQGVSASPLIWASSAPQAVH